MTEPHQNWQTQPSTQVPAWLIQAVNKHAPELPGNYAAALLWYRGIKNPEQIPGFLNPQLYQPASPWEFGQEMNWAIDRIHQAKNNTEKVAIWGDFDADGITSTSVLWDGLGKIFSQNDQLIYYIPNRLTESHGLNIPGIDTLKTSGVSLIITCDTGSTNIAEIKYARSLGIDIIITDHHTLPDDRPDAVAIINPRYLPSNHQLFHLSGVAVAYKLIEALYQTLPDIPQLALTDLLELVAIGLIADLVQLTGDSRYLAQLGIQQLQKQLKNPTRPGVAKLLQLCNKNGDRPTDISFGLGPRINAVSRIQGDASFCVELLTSRDKKRCEELALLTEIANSRRKSLQTSVAKDAAQKLAKLDLSTTSVIVLSDPQWALGVLGLVAGQIAQEYGRPVILFSTETTPEINETLPETQSIQSLDSQIPTVPQSQIARGSARSTNQIDLYQLVKDQAHLLDRFGGHPFAAGLSLPVENIPLFTDAVNQQLRQKYSIESLTASPVQADLTISVAELGKNLFQELKLLEPCGMGNPAPKLLILNCWFDNVWNKNIKDGKGQEIKYIKTRFKIWDESVNTGFPGIWWGHYRDEIPEGRCDAIVELDFNTYEEQYEVRLIALRSRQESNPIQPTHQIDWILDWRSGNPEAELLAASKNLASPISAEHRVDSSEIFDRPNCLILQKCPTSWDEMRIWLRKAQHNQQKLAIAYSLPPAVPPEQIWQQLIGIAKYLSRTQKPVTRQQLGHKLGISDTSLQLGFKTLTHLGFKVNYRDRAFYITRQAETENRGNNISQSLLASQSTQFSDSNSRQLAHWTAKFLAAVSEEQFRHQYFCQVPLSTIQSIARETFFQEDSPAIPF
ncbi:MAG: single-stranded-DNA-specific exonuclease RecJ [Oscillatoriales cyanobacterium]|nr:MAG: single-stranded-DNA-specific exonuclease RecJ [Oscillatoriales cyanobacterium]TAE00144.1 MAG: single-stranded-DNA-specific exonuclease RecJ [Oscillatoriales cyanobacterium]TAF05844.1 MAG: single-stranded-DNA-specific exonuclease RecJ [Oscillatoriales cyanobacterium]TAF37838.1 MAG: single-stranded-DNA-specific exonuclease RecJ [Oscillatoriales cyanobacterium]TAF71580.1 MAG: single-stranded-DNA-specific exonuclease RecJ [Oscillatoriales cyanobacterium]